MSPRCHGVATYYYGTYRPSIRAAMSWVDHNSLANQRWPRSCQRLVLAEQMRTATDHLAAELPQRPKRGRPAGAVRDQTVVALELPQRGRGLGTEDSIAATGIESQLEQALLQGSDVVAHEGTRYPIAQYSVAEPPARLL